MAHVAVTARAACLSVDLLLLAAAAACRGSLQAWLELDEPFRCARSDARPQFLGNVMVKGRGGLLAHANWMDRSTRGRALHPT